MIPTKVFYEQARPGDTDDWLRIHKRTIGGSSAGSCLGHGRFRSPRNVWDDMHDLIVEGKDPILFPENDDLRRGNVFEEVALRLLDHQVGGVTAWDQSRFALNKKYPWAHALPDGDTKDAIVEIKCPRPQTIQKILTKGIFPEWVYQAQHNMAVCGVRLLHFGFLDPISAILHHFPIEMDDAFVEEMMEGERRFYASIEANDPPPERDFSDVPDDDGKVIIRTPEAASLSETYLRLKEIESETKEAIESTKMKIVAACDNVQVVEIPGMARIYHKIGKGRLSLDKASLLEKYPDARQFWKVGAPSRSFKIYDLRNRG